MRQNTPRPGQASQRSRSREEFWRETLGLFATSGQSARAFCAAHGLSEPSFYSWRRTLAERDAAAAKAATPRQPVPAFLPIRVTDAAGGRLEIVLAGGTRIRLHPPVDRGTLAEVVAALEGKPSTLRSLQ